MISLHSPIQMAEHLARRVRERRLEKGWSQKELSERAGIKLPTYVQFERSGKIAFLRLIKVLDVLGLAQQIDTLAAADDFSTRTLDDILKPKRQRGRRAT